MVNRLVIRTLWLVALAALLLGRAEDAAGLRACPHHDAAPASAPSDHHGTHHGDADSEHSACTCMDECTVQPVLPGPARRAAIAVASSIRVDVPAALPDAPRPQRPAFLLPPATAPPLLNRLG